MNPEFLKTNATGSKSGVDGIFTPLSKNCTDWVSEPHYIWPARKEDQVVELGVYRKTPDR